MEGDEKEFEEEAAPKIGSGDDSSDDDDSSENVLDQVDLGDSMDDQNSL